MSPFYDLSMQRIFQSQQKERGCLNQKYKIENNLDFRAVVSKVGINYPPGVIFDSSGVTRNQNHNVVLYYQRSLRNIEPGFPHSIESIEKVLNFEINF